MLATISAACGRRLPKQGRQVCAYSGLDGANLLQVCSSKPRFGGSFRVRLR